MYASKIIALLAISAPIALAAPSADLVARKDGKNFATPGDSCNLPTVIVCSHDQTKTLNCVGGKFTIDKDCGEPTCHGPIGSAVC